MHWHTTDMCRSNANETNNKVVACPAYTLKKMWVFFRELKKAHAVLAAIRFLHMYLKLCWLSHLRVFLLESQVNEQNRERKRKSISRKKTDFRHFWQNICNIYYPCCLSCQIKNLVHHFAATLPANRRPPRAAVVRRDGLGKDWRHGNGTRSKYASWQLLMGSREKVFKARGKKTPQKKNRPIPWPQETHVTYSGEFFFISQGDASTSNRQLNQVFLPIWANSACRNTPVGMGFTSNMFCAGFREGGKDTCQVCISNRFWKTCPWKRETICSFATSCTHVRWWENELVFGCMKKSRGAVILWQATAKRLRSNWNSQIVCLSFEYGGAHCSWL